MLASGDEPWTEGNFPSWQFAFYRIGQLLTKMLGLEAITELQVGGILSGSTLDAIALYDITRRAVRGDRLGRLLPACHFAKKMLSEKSSEHVRRIVTNRKADAMWSAWHQRFVKEASEKSLFEARNVSY